MKKLRHHHEHGHGHHHHGHLHHHGHGHHHVHAHEHAAGNRKGLTIALIITGGIMILEFVGGLLTNSLALLSDSAHMLSDTAAIALSLAAFWFAARPPSANKSYGYYRFEILAALFNGLTLFVMAGFIVFEAYERFIDPPEVAGGTMMVIALVGLAANLISACEPDAEERYQRQYQRPQRLPAHPGRCAGLRGRHLSRTAHAPVRLVYRRSDHQRDRRLVHPAQCLASRQSHHPYLDGRHPPAIDAREVEETLLAIRGVKDLHDLHIWTITSGLDSLSCHLIIEDDQDCQVVLQEAIRRIEERFRIQHTTIQIEKSQLQHASSKNIMQEAFRQSGRNASCCYAWKQNQAMRTSPLNPR